MSDIIDKCPTPETIFKYFHMELDKDELEKVEIHFSKCSKCILNYDHYGNFIEQAAFFAKVQKELWANANTDTVSIAAANSFNNTGISEVVSRDGKYIIKKIPYLEDEHTSLLVVMATIPVKGRLYLHLLEDSANIFIGSELIDEDNKVCFEVNSDIEIRNLLITVL